MRVRVLFFGSLKDLARRSEEALDLPEGATVADLLSRYVAAQSRLRDMLGSIAVSVNAEYARRDATLHDGDEVALLPPVSGGTDASPQRTSIVRDQIDVQRIAEGIKHPSDGAVVIFDGVVRDNSRGRRTLYLDYEAYEPMAARELEKLAVEALSRFAIRDIAIVHRIGSLQIGETSVAIVVVAAHRAAAFDACRWAIDTLKRTVPIWKKEHFVDGAVWADGEAFPPEVVEPECERSGTR
jgi:molybdopterin synthase catalytic subunit